MEVEHRHLVSYPNTSNPVPIDAVQCGLILLELPSLSLGSLIWVYYLRSVESYGGILYLRNPPRRLLDRAMSLECLKDRSRRFPMAMDSGSLLLLQREKGMVYWYVHQ